MLRQAGHRHKAPSAAIGTSESTAGHCGSTTVTTGGEIHNLRVPGKASLLPVQHKPHLLRKDADNHPPFLVASEDVAFDLATYQSIREEADGVLSLLAQTFLRIHAEGEEEDAAVPAPIYVVCSLDRVDILHV